MHITEFESILNFKNHYSIKDRIRLMLNDDSIVVSIIRLS